MSRMGLEERIPKLGNNRHNNHESWAIGMHVFSDLSSTSPVVFLYLLRACYLYGTCKATKKFRVLQQQVYQVLEKAPQPGPASFVAQCLSVLPLFESYSEGFSHLIISSLRRFLKSGTTMEDSLQSKDLAARLFLDILLGIVDHDEKIVAKIVENFDFRLENIERVIRKDEVKNNNSNLHTAKTFVKQYIYGLLESESYMTAVTLLEKFDIRESGQSFLQKLMQKKQYKPAEKWATFMGKSMLHVLIQEFVDMKLLKNAYEIIKTNNLQQEYPDLCHQCKESKLKKFAEKGLWDIAEARTRSDIQLIEYLVYLAMEAGYSEKLDELCARYSLDGFAKAKEPKTNLKHNRYLELKEFLIEDIVWVDDVDSLRNATNHIEGCKVVGLDCEWKPNYVKGSNPGKVSIMQIAFEKMAFIFDMIKLYKDAFDTLDNCLTRIFHSPRILKLGYNFQCDMKQLVSSYGDLECFKHYEMLLDIQNVFKESIGGLSGLAKEVLGTGLDKTRRNCNWEQRPLTQNQQEYAALDAVVLIHIFNHIRTHSQAANVVPGDAQFEWKSQIMPHIANPRKSKKEPKKETEDMTDELLKSD